MNKEENNKDIMDFILNDKETYDNGLSHQALSLKKMKEKKLIEFYKKKKLIINVVKDSMVMKNWFVII